MITTIVGASCLVIGIYAGKRRARGLGWGRIAKDCCHDAASMASRAWSAASSPFRKEDPGVAEAVLSN